MVLILVGVLLVALGVYVKYMEINFKKTLDIYSRM